MKKGKKIYALIPGMEGVVNTDLKICSTGDTLDRSLHPTPLPLVLFFHLHLGHPCPPPYQGRQPERGGQEVFLEDLVRT
jgi:hypothetical protein